MYLPKSNKPRIIALEGAAGVGKTAVQRLLYQALVNKGIPVKIISEFTDSPLGEILKENCQYGSPRPNWLTNTGGTFAFLADKLHALEMASQMPEFIWITDRLITTQLILGLRDIHSELNKTLIREIISVLSSLVKGYFSNDSFLILLEAPLEELKKRMEERIGSPLEGEQLSLLKQEIQDYSNLDRSFEEWNSLRVIASGSIDLVVETLLDEVESKWSQ